MFKKFGPAVFALIILLAASFSPTFAEGPGERGAGGGMVWRLDLTKDQKDKISAQENAVRKETMKLRRAVRDLRNQLNTELSADSPDQAKVNGLIDSISSEMAAMQKQEISFMLWMKGQLTPEQKQKLMELIKNREASEETRGSEK